MQELIILKSILIVALFTKFELYEFVIIDFRKYLPNNSGYGRRKNGRFTAVTI